MKKGYVLYYDVIKIVAAFMVCFYHLGLINVGTVSESFYFPNINKLILNLCSMSVPLFLMVNGALMLRRPYSLNEVIIRFIKIIFLYYFWVFVLGTLGNVFFDTAQISLLDILVGRRTTISVHLWFLRTMAILTLLLPALKKLYDQKSKMMLYMLMLLLLLFPFAYNYFVLAARWLNVESLENLSVTGAFTMYSVLYFLWGKVISDVCAKQSGTCLKYNVFAVIAVVAGWLMVTVEVTLWSNIQGVVYDGVNSSFPTIGALLMASGTFYLLSKVHAAPDSVWNRYIGKYAENIMGVYIFHMFFVYVIGIFIKQTVSVFSAMIVTFLIMSVSAETTYILKKNPYLKELFTI